MNSEIDEQWPSALAAVDGTIFHVTTVQDWRASAAAGEHRISGRGMTLEQEGFIHCSSVDQLPATAARVWGPEHEGLVVLAVDPARLGATELRWEAAKDGQDYPHLYGPLPRDAVVAVMPAHVEAGALKLG